jgi:hypothetical protein
MKMIDAMKIIDGEPTGFMVSFERRIGNLLCGDHFPDLRGGEALIKTENEAWELASKFAKKTIGSVVNLYVIKSDFTAVEGYRDKYIKNR